MPNRLAGSASAYLRQHRDNPVDWYPWGEEAFEKARSEGKPVFLSIGYSSCHWCHVMAHESFEDPGVAELLNRSFVPIKVDREERPDVDDAYMTFVQLVTGRGGWPTSVFLTPDRAPIYGGTYWPRDDRGGHPGFKTICESIARTWSESRDDLVAAADQNSEVLREALQASSPSSSEPDSRPRRDRLTDLIRSGIDALGSRFDTGSAGFGDAPKFPPHTTIEFLQTASAHPAVDPQRRELALRMSEQTLDRMAMGGIHDHVGGGFHRYSTDRVWLLPHFEKMLYDNALMLGNYVRAARSSGSKRFVAVAEGIVGWLEREMASPEGLFYSALDADSEGEEGKFYVWTWDELMQLPEAEAFASTFQVQKVGNFRDEATGRPSGTNILHLVEDPPRDFSSQLRTLLQVRSDRERPGLDDKAIVGWNGLVVAALAEAGRIETAQRAAASILEAERAGGILPHLVVNGAPSGEGFLEDYAFFAFGLIELGDPFRSEAYRLAREMVERFWDHDQGGFFSSSRNHEVLFGSTKPVLDQPLPSGNAVACRLLASVGLIDEAWRTLEGALGWLQRAPHGTEAFYTAALQLLDSETPAGVPPSPAATKPVKISVSETPTGGAVQIVTAPGIHLNSNPAPTNWLVPTEVTFEGASAQVTYPLSSDGRYSGTIEIPFELTDVPGEYEVVVRFQACTESECLAPQEVRSKRGVPGVER